MLSLKSSKHLTFSICLGGVAGVWVLTLNYPLTQLSSILSTPIRTRQGTKYYKKGEQNNGKNTNGNKNHNNYKG